MSDYILISILLSCLFLSYGCVCLYEILYIRSKYGKVILEIDLISFKFQIRSKYPLYFNFSEIIIRKYIKEYFNTNYQFYDGRLLKSMLYVVDDDMLILSDSKFNSIFYYSKLSKLRISRLGMSPIEKYHKYDKLNNVGFAKLLLHEYLHHWSNKHYKSPDINHMGKCWNTIR